MSLEIRKPNANAPMWLVWVAFWIVYIVWGSTYLAIRVTVETLPPLLSAGVRFLIAGSLFYAWLAFRGGRARVRVEPRQVVAAAIVGGALLLGGNGLVSVAEREVSSSLAALIIGSVPLWVVVLRVLTGDRVRAGTLVGVLVGFVGLGILVLPSDRPGDASMWGVLLLVGAAVSWATGSFFSRALPLPKDPLVSTAVQMICGGMLLSIAGAARGELSGIDTGEFSRGSLIALAYLIVVGSWVAFTAYVWLLQNAPISKVATYAYVNPVIAMFLGWAFLSEEITAMMLAGAAVIVASVASIVRKESEPAEAGVEPTPTLATAETS